MKVPWDYIEGSSKQADISKPSLKPNLPSDLGRALGYEMQRLFLASLDGKPDNRCADCAFRLNSAPNGSEASLMNAMKCIMEGKPFNCHMENKPCAGFVLMRQKALKLTKVAQS